MPELPEVETTARGLRAQLVGRRVDSVDVLWGRTVANLDPELLPLALLGRTLSAVGRRGKLLLLHFDDGSTAAVHRRMTGNLLVRRADESCRDRHNCPSATSIALSSPFALLRVSSYSLSGTLSATRPAPAWT